VLNTALLVGLNQWTNRTFVLPVAVFFPTSRCNSRCVSCDWWKATGERDLTRDEIAGVAEGLADLGTRVVLFSGGEPLLRPDVFEIAALFRRQGIELHLHTSGVLLERHAHRVAEAFARVIVSLDRQTKEGYRAIRGVAALPAIERGVAKLRVMNPDLPVSARSTLHKLNFRDLPRLVAHARAMSVDSISFLAADMSMGSFGPGVRSRLPRACAGTRRDCRVCRHHRTHDCRAERRLHLGLRRRVAGQTAPPAAVLTRPSPASRHFQP
jgi:organic radical activating enzyme